jgi:putative ABC transport system substrate-binding protein
VNRRAFIAGLGSVAAWPMVARAQRRMAVIGFLGPASATGFAPYLQAFRRGLGEAGFVEGGTLQSNIAGRTIKPIGCRRSRSS